MRILLAENDSATREYIEERLVAEGFDVTTASEGFGAFVAFNEGSFPLVICQRNLPEMDGLQFCRSIRQDVRNSGTYFIMLTATSRSNVIEEALEAGVDDYVLKPLNPADLVMRANIARRAINSASHDMLALTFSKLVELRCKETGNHMQRIRDYSQVLAKEMSKSDRFRDVIDTGFIRTLGQTSWLHDIGKVAIPDSILLKAGALTARERSEMETHSEIGAEVFLASLATYPENQFVRMAYDITMSHHEKWDGSGYPQGLEGEQIPLSARIVAVADVYDALTSVRVYNKSMDHDFAAELIVESSGKHFDPDIVDSFEDASEFIQEVKERWPDVEGNENRETSDGPASVDDQRIEA